MYCFMMFSERPLKKSTSCQLCLTYGITLCGILALSSAVYLIPFDPSVRSQNGFGWSLQSSWLPKTTQTRRIVGSTSTTWWSSIGVLTTLTWSKSGVGFFIRTVEWNKSRTTTWDVLSAVNNWINYQPQQVNAGCLFHQQYHGDPVYTWKHTPRWLVMFEANRPQFFKKLWPKTDP